MHTIRHDSGKLKPKQRVQWEVRFNTTGTANLTIRAINGTTWSNTNENQDLKFLELRCGNSSVSYEWLNNSVVAQDYACNETGHERSCWVSVGSKRKTIVGRERRLIHPFRQDNPRKAHLHRPR